MNPADYPRVELRRREGEFLSWKTLRVFCGTWNVNERQPPSHLCSWLIGGLPEPADIVAIGLQEIDMSAAGLMSVEREGKYRPWLDCIERTLQTAYPGITYRMVEYRQLVGMLLAVSIRSDILHYVHDVQVETAGTGLMGVLGNKGAIALSMRVFDSSFCFVNAHLAANTHNVERRNQDFQEIGRRILFDPEKSELDSEINEALTAAGVVQGDRGETASRTIFDHDYVFWFGDLNYRLPSSLGYEHIVNACHEGKPEALARLLVHDQLVQQRAAGNAFQDFTEPPITFPCTYKFVPGTSDYSPYNPEKQRLPAWCDRIMWMAQSRSKNQLRRSSVHGQTGAGLPESTEAFLASFDMYAAGASAVYDVASDELDTSTPSPPRSAPHSLATAPNMEYFIPLVDTTRDTEDTRDYSIVHRAAFPSEPWLLSSSFTSATPGEYVECLQYAALDAPLLQRSDHRPVRGVFLVRVRDADVTQRSAVLRSIMERIGDLENASLPMLELSNNFIEFGTLRHNQVRTRTILLTNTGTTPVEFSFVAKPSGQLLPPWLFLSHTHGYLAPGENVELRLSAVVNDQLAPLLNSGEVKLEDILVLHLAGGRDHFITISGDWRPSCLGGDLEQLLAATVQHWPAARLPVQFWILGELLTRLGDGLDSPDLFVRSGPEQEIAQIREVLDTPLHQIEAAHEQFLMKAQEQHWTAHSAATVLLHFISSLRTPVWPENQYKAAVAVAGSSSACKQLLSTALIRPANYAALLYIIALLRDISSRYEKNHLPADQLAIIFSSILMRPPQGVQPDQYKASIFLQSLLTQE